METEIQPREGSSQVGEDLIDIKVKTIGAATYPLKVHRDVNILELKGLLKDTTNVEVEQQRLIYRGKILKDSDSLDSYHVENGHTLHMVSRPPDLPQVTTPPAPEPQPALTSTGTQGGAVLTGGTSAALTSLLSGFFSNRGAAATRTRPTNVQSQPEQQQPRDMENVHQTLLTLGTLLATFQEHGAGQRDRSAPRFRLGQWLDVRDTVNQWLEATVTDINDNEVFVHYNGWPSRWDEWIPFSSDRLAPFRTRTVHAARGIAQCPQISQPMQDPPSIGSNNIEIVLPQVRDTMTRVLPFLEEACRHIENRPPSSQAQNVGESSSSAAEVHLPGAPVEGATSADSLVAPVSAVPSLVSSSSVSHSNEHVASNLPAEDEDMGDISDVDGTLGNLGSQDGHAIDDSSTPSPPSNASNAARVMELAALLERLGRVLTDTAPHLVQYAETLASDIPEEVGVTQTSSANTIVTPTSSQHGATRQRLFDQNPYARPLHVSAPQDGRSQNNIDIHIHAILTPMRGLSALTSRQGGSTGSGLPGSSARTLRQRRPNRTSSVGVSSLVGNSDSNTTNPGMQSLMERIASESTRSSTALDRSSLDRSALLSRNDMGTSEARSDEGNSRPAHPSSGEASGRPSRDSDNDSSSQEQNLSSSLLSIFRRAFSRRPSSRSSESHDTGADRPSTTSRMVAEPSASSEAGSSTAPQETTNMWEAINALPARGEDSDDRVASNSADSVLSSTGSRQGEQAGAERPSAMPPTSDSESDGEYW